MSEGQEGRGQISGSMNAGNVEISPWSCEESWKDKVYRDGHVAADIPGCNLDLTDLRPLRAPVGSIVHHLLPNQLQVYGRYFHIALLDGHLTC